MSISDIKDDNITQKLNMSLDAIIEDEKDRGSEKEEQKRSGSAESQEREDRKDSDEKQAPPGFKVFVGNLSFRTTWQTLKDYMRDIGDVTRVHIFEDRDRRSKGCGLVEFANLEDAHKAIKQLHETYLEGRQIYVREDNPDMAKFDHEHYRSKRSERPRRSGSRNRRHSRSRSRSHGRRRHHRSRSRSHSGRRNRDRGHSRRSRSRSYDRDRRRNRSRSRSDRSRSRDKGGKEDGHQIIVKNIPWTVTWQQLKDAFREFGPIIRADIPQDHQEQGRSVGYGFVKFEREKDAYTAIDNMDGAAFNGRKITVKFSDRY